MHYYFPNYSNLLLLTFIFFSFLFLTTFLNSLLFFITLFCVQLNKINFNKDNKNYNFLLIRNCKTLYFMGKKCSALIQSEFAFILKVILIFIKFLDAKFRCHLAIIYLLNYYYFFESKHLETSNLFRIVSNKNI